MAFSIHSWLFFALNALLNLFVFISAIDTILEYFLLEGIVQLHFHLGLFTYFLAQFISDRFSLKELLNPFVIKFLPEVVT